MNTYSIKMQMKRSLYCKGVVYLLAMSLYCNADAQNKPYRAHMISSTQLNSLGHTIRSNVVSIRRQGYPATGYHLPQLRLNWGQGILVSDQLVLTSAHWLKLNPDESKMSIQTKCLHKQELNMVNAKVVAQSKKEGWVILKTQSALSCKPVKHSQPISDSDFHIGRGLYVAESKPRLPSRLTLSGIAPSPMHFYWLISGHLISGAPLFDQNGHLITLAVVPHTRPESNHFYSLVLPPKAIQSAFEKIDMLTSKSN